MAINILQVHVFLTIYAKYWKIFFHQGIVIYLWYDFCFHSFLFLKRIMLITVLSKIDFSFVKNFLLFLKEI